ncbi:MAG: patatin-like phospholipase family protein [Gammaproteobacteria bacterium]
MKINKSAHRPFALVLPGGGVRGLAHAGILKGMEYYGWRPSAIVGVSMGAIVAATYGLNADWYRALVNMDTRDFPGPPVASSADLRERIRALLASERALREMLLGWGVGSRSLKQGQALLAALTQGCNLEEARLPLAVVATELRSGRRMILRQGPAAQMVYASAALPGILPPLKHEDALLSDGTYVDNAPVDVARDFGVEVVIAVDTTQINNHLVIRNGLQAMMRAMEICHHSHSQLRFKKADFVLRPDYPFAIEYLFFFRLFI